MGYVEATAKRVLNCRQSQRLRHEARKHLLKTGLVDHEPIAKRAQIQNDLGDIRTAFECGKRLLQILIKTTLSS